jgi:hypothetical protein
MLKKGLPSLANAASVQQRRHGRYCDKFGNVGTKLRCSVEGFVIDGRRGIQRGVEENTRPNALIGHFVQAGEDNANAKICEGQHQ